MHRILVIDDDPTGTQLLLTLLGLEGYEGLKLQDWANPVRDVQRQHPDLVVMDVHLSAFDGLDLLRHLRAQADPYLAHLPVLMMSAEDLREQCESAGADGFVEKPFELDAMIEAIQNIMEGSV
jgi:two-component system OmpR family response regulator